MNTNTPRIYAACLAAYNNGRLHGKWIDADQSADAIQDEIDAMLKTSPEPDAEEWAIHDYDNMPTGLGEWPDLEDVAKVAEAIEQHGEAFRIALEYFGGDCDDALDAMEQYCGCYDSQADFAAEWTENSGALADVPEFCQSYIDYDAMGRDMVRGGGFWADRGNEGLHVFRDV